MHRLGDVVDVRLVEAQPIAGALRFELLSEGQPVPRGRNQDRFARGGPKRPGRSPNEKKRKEKKKHKTRNKPEKKKSGKSKRGKSWKP
jgi:ribonuclease R